MSRRSRYLDGCFMILIVLGVSPGIQAQTPEDIEAEAPPDPEEMVEEALEKIDSGDIVSASRLFQQAARLKPTLIKLKLVEGLLYLEEKPKRGPDALFVLGQYNKTKEGKDDYRGFAAVGRLYLENGQPPLATYQLDKAVNLAPTVENGKPVRARITADLARAYAGQKKMRKAVETAQQAAGEAPNDGDIQLGLSEIALMANKPELVVTATERAIAVFTSKIRDDAFNEDAHAKLIGCYEIVKKLYAFYLRNEPENGEHFYQVAKVLIDLAETQRRLDLLTSRGLILRAIELDPKNTDWRLFAARLEYELGGIDEAKDRVAKILLDDPENQQALRLKQRIESLAARGDQPTTP